MIGMVYLVTDTVCIILVVPSTTCTSHEKERMDAHMWTHHCGVHHTQPTLCVLTNMECTSAGYMSGTNELHMWQFHVEIECCSVVF